MIFFTACLDWVTLWSRHAHTVKSSQVVPFFSLHHLCTYPFSNRFLAKSCLEKIVWLSPFSHVCSTPSVQLPCWLSSSIDGSSDWPSFRSPAWLFDSGCIFAFYPLHQIICWLSCTCLSILLYPILHTFFKGFFLNTVLCSDPLVVSFSIEVFSFPSPLQNQLVVCFLPQVYIIIRLFSLLLLSCWARTCDSSDTSC